MFSYPVAYKKAPFDEAYAEMQKHIANKEKK